MDTFFVIQAQSIGLWVDDFAVGLAILNKECCLEEHYFSCPSYRAEGLIDDRHWVVENVTPYLPSTTQ